MDYTPEIYAGLYLPHTVARMRTEAADYNGPVGYVEFLRQRYLDTRLGGGMLKMMAEHIEPIDPVLGIDKNAPNAVAFYKGGLLGARAVEHALGAQFFRHLCDTPVQAAGVADITEPLLVTHSHATVFAETGDIGYSNAEPYHELIEEWEDVVVPTVTSQVFMRRGFGVVMYQTQRTQQRLDHEELTAWVDTDAETHDWDAELRSL